ncbi:orotidine-5'-phosphate decarboxylase [Falsibacillus albus]|uniref:Orotidine 5'-phosphate decarboxylase n=1 Tax=Falsibacillus albus TaxID=2478915 RepID=A0A3L7K1G3_9BACI|nr:orotidine-5'-phosphate decarboxylase [Falsibacillus albus]RLQ95801.1 orotidine-5'-phosphate decarboxylase [Falsibacillus albus]
MIKKPIIALDFSSMDEVVCFLETFTSDEPLYVKVGMELYYQAGPQIIGFLKEKGHQIFLDLKLHDIPNTVYQAMKGLARLGVDMVNVHAAGGKKMMEAALKGLEDGTSIGQKRPKLIAVTQLTSTSEEEMQYGQLIKATLMESVIHYAKQAHEAGLDGVVCSAQEAKHILLATTDRFMCVTPGIRMAEDDKNDQLRVMTPSQARKNGAAAIVVGRSITKKSNPRMAYEQIKDEWMVEIENEKLYS